MPLSAYDERDLLRPLLWGISEQPLWQTFLRRLRARTQARHVCLLLGASGPNPPRGQRHASADPALPAPNMLELNDIGLIPFAILRPERVYALEEMLNLDAPGHRRAQERVMADNAIAHARFIRVNGRDDRAALLAIFHDRVDFSAGDSALLSSLAPLIGAALDTLAALDSLRLRTAMAEEALGMLGIGQTALDNEGRIVVADPLAVAQLNQSMPGSPIQGIHTSHAVAEACAEIAGKPATTRRLIHRENDEPGDVLIRPVPPLADLALPPAAVATATIRQPRREDPRSAARVIAASLGLSAREAALAEAISRGATIIEAGASLQLTPETARNYTKRIYAKTGARGQADLVRLVLTSLSPLA